MSTSTRIGTRTTDTMDLPARSGSNVSGEESSGSSEDRVRKFQRTTDNGSRLRKTSASNAMSATSRPPPAINNPALRGRVKHPLGPRERPQDFSKPRITSGTSVSSAENRSFLPTLSNEATTRSATSNPRFSFSTQQGHSNSPSEPVIEPTETYDFLPAVNFDDFANSLSYEPDLSDFPAPGTFKTSVPVSNSTPNMQTSAGATAGDARPTRSNSFVRRFSQSTARQASVASTASDASTMPPPASNMAIRTRRQSQFPAPAPQNPAARPPRKSVGPGMLPTNSSDGMSRLHNDSSQLPIGRAPSLNRGARRETLSSNFNPPNLTTGVPKLPNATRNAKAKSFQPPSRQQSGNLTSASSVPDPDSTPIGQTRSPGKFFAQRAHTPSSSSSKRQSTVHHISGLGARTISPTDARRLKRLSMNPNAPGGPVAPPTPQGDMSFDERAFSNSPAILFDKSVTPSSARATPEQNRKSYASGISLSSNSSLNSLTKGGSAIPTRANPVLSGSRLPTPKPRNVHSSAGGEEPEEVPPVPAIPKAYESPKDPERSSFSFSTSSFKSHMPAPPPSAPPAGNSGTNAAPQAETPHNQSIRSEMSKGSTGSIRHRRGLTVGSGSEPDRTPVAQPSTKKNLQPIRLPPLNLLPLSTPFNNRISSFPAPSGEVENRNVTPPPKRAVNKTPSTPMTASKASFFNKSGPHKNHDFEQQIRSSSSAYNLRAAEPFGGPPAIGTMPIPTLNPTRQTTTPFASNSLPKGSGEFARLQSRPSGEHYTGAKDVEMQHIKPAGARPLQKKDTSDSAHTSTSTEPETPSSASSLRRKLSLSGWRRAPSKAATHTAQNTPVRRSSQKPDDAAPQSAKHGDMPPPRLPASATWTGGLGSLGTSPTPATNRTRPSLDFGRRKTSTATVASDTELEKPGVRKPSVTAGMRTLSGYNDSAGAQGVPKSASSILTPMQRMLGSKSSSNMLKSRNLDPNLDKDDLMADEEMKKLASKRKDFENAARDVDELRKRAKPQERVSPAQALQMVNLNIFERGEIIDYKEIFFCGTKSAKKHVGDLNAKTANFGYDDDRGDYNIVFGDHLAYRYEVVDLLGKGSFGQVVRCVDHKTGGLVAIKIIRNKKRFHQQALVEVNILQKLREWDPDNKHSMINFTQSFYFRGHLCISTELLGMNLYEFIKAHEFKGFSLRLIRRFCKQMLASLVLLKTQRVIHCDLKPENILLAHPLHSEIKVIDFGSSCFENEKVYTYIQSRFYRSPEVILGMSYGLAIDMWSLGCILAELLTGYPIFPGENEQEQLACIMEIFGPPEKHLIEKSSRKKLFFDSLGKPRVTVSTKGRRRRPSSKTLQQALKCDDDNFLDFIARCLRWDPERRMKPDEAMLHPFITGIRQSARQRQPLNGMSGVSSPAKRVATSQTPQSRVRPLPEPPATSFKNGAAVNTNREVSSSNSPVKGAAPQRRHSTVQGAPGPAGVKRTVNGAPLNSGLPRVAQRSVSGKPDLASAAAIASLSSSTRR
ncbi:dual-specificity kinase [Parastagonospora nodorum]|nr:dual-specificity kinase [Parastagonospora nodorum]